MHWPVPLFVLSRVLSKATKSVKAYNIHDLVFILQPDIHYWNIEIVEIGLFVHSS